MTGGGGGREVGSCRSKVIIYTVLLYICTHNSYIEAAGGPQSEDLLLWRMRLTEVSLAKLGGVFLSRLTLLGADEMFHSFPA